MDPRLNWLSWIELDLAALRHNLAAFRSLLTPSTQLLFVVKANAYGHGLEPIVRAAASSVDAFGVHAIGEAEQVRQAGWQGRLLVMGGIARRELEAVVRLSLDVTVFDSGTVRLLDELGQARGASIPCHLKVETGTHRQGADPEDLPELLALLKGARGVRLEGLSTHFANIEDTTDHGYAQTQLARFRVIADEVRARGFNQVVRHTACTAAALTLPETTFEMVRLGIGGYGLWPSRETLASTRARSGERLELRPVLSWKARITELKWVEAGEYVGYGLSYRTGHRTRLAVLPIGYSDGYDRGLSGLAHVLVHGRRAPVLGRVCMNILLCDVTDVGEAKIEDEVVLLGTVDGESVGADKLAAWAQTIPYEIVARLSPTLPRVAVEDGAPIQQLR